MEGLILFAVLILVLVVVAPIVSLVWLTRLSDRIAHLSQRVARIEQRQLAATQAERSGALAPSAAGEEPESPATDVSAGMPAETAVESLADIASDIPAQFLDEAIETPKPQPPAAPPVKQGPGWEERLAASWMIWLGGLTVALAAVFLFRYAVDQGWLTPMIRVVMGLLLGGALLAGGEWTLRAAPREGAALPDYVPPALSASGIFAILVSLFAAHAMYGFLGPATAFIALGLTAYSALVLSLRQGWFVALLGILAGYLIPLMITSPESNAVATFVYLYVLTLGALALMVWRRWRWFSILAMLGAFAWPVIWTLGPWTMADQGALGSYALALAASFAALSTRLPMAHPKHPAWAWVAEVLADTSGLGFALSGVLLVYLAHVADHNAAAFAFLVAYAVIALGTGIWRRSLEGLLPVAALVALAAMLLWPEPAAISPPERVQELGLEGGAANAFGPWVMPPEFYAYSRALWAFAAVFGLGGFFALWRIRAIPVWAGLSAFLPLLLFLIGYWRIGDFEIDIRWAWWAIGLAVLMLLAAVTVHRRLPDPARNVALGFYAAGVTGAIALAFTCLFREAWLTVALAAQVAALAWIWSMLRVEALKAVAVSVLLAVAIRLVLNPMILEYEGGFLGMFGWVVYGYGLPAAASFYAARTFARDGRDVTVTLAEIAGLGFAFLTVSLQLKLWTSGSIYTPFWDFLDMAVQAIWWGVAGALLLYKPFLKDRPWALPVGIAVLAITGIVVFGGLLITNNPLFSRDYVGSWPLVNLLTLGYLVPAAFCGFLAASRRFEIAPAFRRLMSAGAGVLVFADLTLEVRRAFWGQVLHLNWETQPSNAEIYAYSAVWTVFALALLALGIMRRSQGLRYASLAVLLATVAKVFLYDMSDLTGLFRVASFLGLGLTLIGIGGVYRRFVFRNDDAEKT